MRTNILFLSLAALLALAACRQQQPSLTEIQLAMSVSDTLVGETTLLMTVTDEDGNTLPDPGTLKVRADMDHAGMAPVRAQADKAIDGVFTIPFEWTMGGSWIIEASLTLDNGTVASETFRYQILSVAGAADMASMDHDEMQRGGDTASLDQAPASGETSAIYMRISNRSENDITITSATSAAAEHIAFHVSTVENDMARMVALDGLHIPAGETIELAPGGVHIMLMSLTADLLPDSQIALQLHCDKGEVYDLDISVIDMLVTELQNEVEIGELVFGNRWARPARAGIDKSN